MIIIKSKREIDGIRRSGMLAADVLLYASKLVKEGVTTLDINNTAAKMIQDHGAKPACLGYRGFPKEICVSVNDEICHGIPSNRKLVNGDVVKIDVTTILDGFFGDTAATYIVGHGNSSTQQLRDITLLSLQYGLNEVQPGVRVGKIGHVISCLAADYGYSVVDDYAGHGCGIHFHEEPQILHICKENYGSIMQSGMTFTIEPMLCQNSSKTMVGVDKWTAKTIDGGLSAQFEHTVLVTETGYEILTLPSVGKAFVS